MSRQSACETVCGGVCVFLDAVIYAWTGPQRVPTAHPDSTHTTLSLHTFPSYSYLPSSPIPLFSASGNFHLTRPCSEQLSRTLPRARPQSTGRPPSTNTPASDRSNLFNRSKNVAGQLTLNSSVALGIATCFSLRLPLLKSYVVKRCVVQNKVISD